MSPVGLTEWTLLVKFRRQEAASKILAAMRASGGNAVQAAAALGIPHRSWLRYCNELGLAAEFATIRAAARRRRITGE